MRRIVSSGSLRALQPEQQTVRPHLATAPRACYVCTRGKRKCDKLLPKCHRCARLDLPCGYESLPGTPSSSASEGTEDLATIKSTPQWELPGLREIFRCSQVNWRQSIKQYFETVHVWFCIINQNDFETKLDTHFNSGHGAESSFEDLTASGGPPELAILVLSMHILVQSAEMWDRGGAFGPIYETAKRAIALRSCLSEPSVEVAQCGALLALFEFGHGRAKYAYRTLSEASANARIIGIKPENHHSKHASMQHQVKDNHGSIWWGLFILDQYIHLDDGVRDLPPIIEPPRANDMLPTGCAHWGFQDSSLADKEVAADTPLTVNLATFQRSAQAAILLHRAHTWSREVINSDSLRSVEVVASLDQSVRDLLNSMINQDERWEVFCDSFAMCLCSIFIVFRPYLEAFGSSQHQLTEEDLVKATANVRFAIQFVTDLSLSFNAHLEKNPGWLTNLAPPAIMSCALALEAIAMMASGFGENHKAVADISQSVMIFSKRWNLGSQHIRSE